MWQGVGKAAHGVTAQWQRRAGLCWGMARQCGGNARRRSAPTCKGGGSQSIAKHGDGEASKCRAKSSRAAAQRGAAWICEAEAKRSEEQQRQRVAENAEICRDKQRQSEVTNRRAELRKGVEVLIRAQQWQRSAESRVARQRKGKAERRIAMALRCIAKAMNSLVQL